MNSHPYRSAPQSSFWSRAVSKDWNPSQLFRAASQEPLIRKGDKVMSAGSCFASNIIPYLERAGLTYLRTEDPHPAFQDVEPEALGYANFSAANGNIYTARQLLQLLKRCCNIFTPVEDRWNIGDEVVDALRPGLRYRARSDYEFELLTAQHLRKSYAAFEQAGVFIFTLGLTEAWVSRLDGTVFPACPGTVAGCFDPARHGFKNFSVAEVCADLNEVVNLLRRISPGVRIILTVSPVPLVATATDNHVLSATTYSKSVLRAAAEHVRRSHSAVTYFPAFEIITGPQAPHAFFEADRRTVSQAGIDAVMGALLAHCEADSLSAAGTSGPPLSEIEQEFGSVKGASAAELSRMIAAAECEEEMTDPSLLSPVRKAPAAAALIREEATTETNIPPLGIRELQERDRERAHNDALLEDLRARLAALDAIVNRISCERDALATAAARWFEAAIAITAHHNPLMAPARRARSGWWQNFMRRVNASRLRGLPPLVLADRACSARQWELAVRYYRDALDINPKDPTIWLKCGYALRAAGKAAEAEVALGKAFEYFDFPPTLAAQHAIRAAASDTSAGSGSRASPELR